MDIKDSGKRVLRKWSQRLSTVWRRRCLFQRRIDLNSQLLGKAQVRSFGDNGAKPKGAAYTMSRGQRRVGCGMIYIQTTYYMNTFDA
jgi:hypothetical protein